MAIIAGGGIIQIQIVKDYLNLDYDDSLLHMYVQTAIDYVANGVDDFYNKYEKTDFENLADMVILVITQEIYDNRNQMNWNQGYSYIIRGMMTQLQYYEVV